MGFHVRFVAEIGLRVSDLAGMVAFYERELGFEVHLAREKHVFMTIAELPSPLGEIGHPQVLGLFARDAAPEAARSTLDHLAFEIPAEEYDSAFERFNSRSLVIRTREWPDSLDWRGKSFFIHDPEGNTIELICALDPEI